MTDADREFLIAVRSILLMAVDKIDRRCSLGKYKGVVPLPPTDTATFSGIIESAPRVDVTAEQKG